MEIEFRDIRDNRIYKENGEIRKYRENREALGMGKNMKVKNILNGNIEYIEYSGKYQK